MIIYAQPLVEKDTGMGNQYHVRSGRQNCIHEYSYPKNFNKQTHAAQNTIIIYLRMLCIKTGGTDRQKAPRWEASCADTIGTEMVLKSLVRQSRMEEESSASVPDQGLKDWGQNIIPSKLYNTIGSINSHPIPLLPAF